MPTTSITRCGGGSGGGGASTEILSLGPDAFWKLNEQSGTTAHDSSGNGYDLTPPFGFVAPGWGGPILPPGETSAIWTSSPSVTRLTTAALPAYAGDFTVGGWFERTTDQQSYACFAVGNGLTNGYGLIIEAGNQSPGPNAAIFQINGIGSQVQIISDQPLINNVAYALCVRRQSGVCNLFVGGTKQTSAPTPPYNATTGFAMGSATLSYSSYVYAFAHALSDAQILAITTSV
jgi:hypothetical protein